MQNRYTGDIGDFGKMGLLRRIRKADFSIGVNWYLTPDESHNGDGRHIGYLRNEAFRDCDEQLWQVLGDIVDSGKRQVGNWRADDFYVLQHRNLIGCGAFPDAKGLGLKFKTTSQRYYFFLMQPHHADRIMNCVREMMETEWKRHFEVVG